MEIIIIINGVGRRFDVEKPIECSDTEMQEWVFAELTNSELDKNNSLFDYSLGEITYICELSKKQ